MKLPFSRIIERIRSLSEPKKFYVSVFLSGLAFSIAVFYFNFTKLKSYYYRQAEENAAIISSAINESLNIYKEILLTISPRVSSSDIIIDSQKIAFLLRQFHLSNNSTDKINFTDIRWFDARNKIVVNQYGALKTDLETSLALPVNISTQLQTFPGQMFMVEANDNLSLKESSQLHLLMGVANAKKEYVGYLTILPNFENWIQSLKQKINESELIAAIADKEKRILFATDSNLENQFIKKQNISISYKGYYFTNSLPIPYSSFSLITGYSERNFWLALQSAIIPQFLVLIITCLFSVTLFWRFRKSIYNEIKEQFSLVIETLTIDNKNYKNNINKLTSAFSDKEKLYKSQLKYNNDFLEAHKISDLERSKLLSVIYKNISASLIEIQDLTRKIRQSKKGTDFKSQQSGEAEVLTEIENKVKSLASFCIQKQNNQAKIEDIINCLVKIYAKEIFKKNLKISVRIKANAKTINLDHLLFYQILGSLLDASIDAARPNGTITLEVFKKKVQKIKMLFIHIKDNGFYLRGINDEYLSDNAICTLCLSFNAIQNILEEYGGTINTIFTKDGKTVEFIVPYNRMYDKEAKDNVIPLIRP